MQRLTQIIQLLPVPSLVIIILVAMLNQTASAQDDGYWDDRFGANIFDRDSYIQSVGVTDNGDMFISGNLYAGGHGTGIMKWNGSGWSLFGSGTGPAYAFLQIDNDLYLGGAFTKVDGIIPANNIAKYNLVTQTWSPLGSGGNNGTDHIVRALALHGNDLYVGGSFTTAGGIPANHIAKYNIVTKTWTSLGDGINGTVQAIAVKNGEVYVGGQFQSAGGVSANNIAKWNGREWSALGSSVNSIVYALTFCGDDLYVGGIFTQAGGSPANYVAKWNTVAHIWSDVGGGVSGGSVGVFALASNGHMVYVGGTFTIAGEIEAYNIAKWNPAKSCWSRLSSGLAGFVGISSMYTHVNSILVRANDVYVGGQFGKAGGKPSNLFAVWHEPKSPSPHVPAWSSVPDVTLAEDDSTKLELYQFVTDIEHSLQGLNFKASVINFQKAGTDIKSSPVSLKNELGSSQSSGPNGVQIRFEKMIMGPNGRYEYATFKSANNTSGIYTVVFTVTDPCGASDSDTIKVTVTPVNNPPVLASLPELHFNEDKTLFHPIRHWYPFVTDADDADSTLKFTVLSGKQVKATRHPRGHSFVAPANWFGRDTLQVIVTDPSRLADTTALVITVDPINDRPQLIDMPDSLSFKKGASTQLKMWDLVEDVETPDSLLLYRFATSKPGLRWSFQRATGTLVLTAPQFHGNARLFVKVGDSKAAAFDTIAVRVEMPSDIFAATEKQNSNEQIPTEFVLQQNYPNPFNPTTLIRFGLPQEAEVKLEILNLTGQRIITLLHERQPAGYHEIEFNAGNLASGVYFYRLTAGNFMAMRKLMLVR